MSAIFNNASMIQTGHTLSIIRSNSHSGRSSSQRRGPYLYKFDVTMGRMTTDQDKYFDITKELRHLDYGTETLTTGINTVFTPNRGTWQDTPPTVVTQRYLGQKGNKVSINAGVLGVAQTGVLLDGDYLQLTGDSKVYQVVGDYNIADVPVSDNSVTSKDMRSWSLYDQDETSVAALNGVNGIERVSKIGKKVKASFDDHKLKLGHRLMFSVDMNEFQDGTVGFVNPGFLAGETDVTDWTTDIVDNNQWESFCSFEYQAENIKFTGEMHSGTGTTTARSDEAIVYTVFYDYVTSGQVKLTVVKGTTLGEYSFDTNLTALTGSDLLVDEKVHTVTTGGGDLSFAVDHRSKGSRYTSAQDSVLFTNLPRVSVGLLPNTVTEPTVVNADTGEAKVTLNCPLVASPTSVSQVKAGSNVKWTVALVKYDDPTFTPLSAGSNLVEWGTFEFEEVVGTTGVDVENL